MYCSRPLQTTARGPHPAHRIFSSGQRTCLMNDSVFRYRVINECLKKKIKKCWVPFCVTVTYFENCENFPLFKVFLPPSSSSLARQPYMDPWLPQKLLPTKVSGYCFFRFRDKSLSQGGVVSPTPTPRLSWKVNFSVRVFYRRCRVQILKRQDLAFCSCMT
jgi:hypothetical protein